MINPRLEKIQESIGKEMKGSPSPLGRWLRGRLLAAEEGSVTAEYIIREEMTNPAGIIHGGMVAAILDDLIGMTVYALGRPHFYTSVNLQVDFLLSARLGETINARTSIIRAGMTMINAAGELRNEEGALLARATSNLLRVNLPLP